MKNLLVAQSGGPTAAINATLAGVFESAKLHGEVDKIYGAINGIQGVFEEKLIELEPLLGNTILLDLLCQTPAAALGSCRFKLDDFSENKEQFDTIIHIFRKYNISYFIYIGGNDSMDTVYKLSEYLKYNEITDIAVIGAPKTVDNDLVEIDHCPGFGSAAKYIATTIAELERDITVYAAPSVTIVEIMGRNAGWLTASAALARLNGGAGPNLIYLCEPIFDTERFLKDVKAKLKENRSILVAISEGIKDAEGNYISEQTQCGVVDGFGHKYIAGAARVLEDLVRAEIGCKVRAIELNLMQRAASHVASATDLHESKLLGMKALECATGGKSGHMASIRRTSSDPYAIELSSVPVSKVANHEKKVPLELINDEHNDVTEEMINYLKPLIQGEVLTHYENGIPKHINILKNIK